MDALALISHDALDESSSVPLYCQLKHRILQLIATGTLGAGEALPTEQALCETFGLSRATVRRCYRDLVDEGYATRRRGRGSFVSLPEESSRLDTIYQQVSTSSAIGRSGARPGSRFLGIKVVPAAGAAARSLGVADGAPLWEINRLRLADKDPVVHELAYVPQALCPRLDSANLESASLYQCIAEESGELASRTEEYVEAITLDRREARMLETSPGSAALRIVARSLGTQGQPLETSVGIARADRLRVETAYDIDGSSARKVVV